MKLGKMTQNYDAYTAEDFQVWKLLYEHQLPLLRDRAATAHLQGLKKVGFTANEIPHFPDVNRLLMAETGWSLEVVPGLIPDKDFFELLSNNKFPSSTWIREMKSLDYLEEPDMFHDCFAHVPMLTNQWFVDYLQQLSSLALRFIDDPVAIELIGRVYWFTVEFGLINEPVGRRIYGAGILSSKGETIFALTPEANHRTFNIREMISLPYYKDHFQDRYYVIDSYQQLFDALPDIKHWLTKALTAQNRSTNNVSAIKIEFDDI
jgi:phenylalanine-4-hydroxylase